MVQTHSDVKDAESSAVHEPGSLAVTAEDLLIAYGQAARRRRERAAQIAEEKVMEECTFRPNIGTRHSSSKRGPSGTARLEQLYSDHAIRAERRKLAVKKQQEAREQEVSV